MNPSASQVASPVADVRRLVPMAHVADVESSLRFYAMLGFREQSRHRGPTGRTVWAHAVSGDGLGAGGAAEIMFAQASGVVPAEEQAVLFYMYSGDIVSLRARLLSAGVRDGGDCGEGKPPRYSRDAVYQINRPFYMEKGELRVADLDGYVVLVGQV